MKLSALPEAMRITRPRDFRDISRVVYCIGAQKAGTTWLYKQLRRHPEVHLGRPKEVHYWDTIYFPHLPYYSAKARKERAELEGQPLHHRVRRLGLRGAYRSARRARLYDEMLNRPDAGHRTYQNFVSAGSAGKPIVGDISPGYAMVDREGFAAMDAASPEARFLFIMRDPVDRLWSNVRHYRARGFNGSVGDAGLDARFDRAIEEIREGPFQRSDYARTISELEAVVPAERIGYFFYETLFSPAEMARMAAFLGIGEIAPDASRRVNPGSDPEARPREDLVRKARERLAHVYDMAHDRFGDDLPEAWRAGPTQQPSARRDGHGR